MREYESQEEIFWLPSLHGHFMERETEIVRKQKKIIGVLYDREWIK